MEYITPDGFVFNIIDADTFQINVSFQMEGMEQAAKRSSTFKLSENEPIIIKDVHEYDGRIVERDLAKHPARPYEIASDLAAIIHAAKYPDTPAELQEIVSRIGFYMQSPDGAELKKAMAQAYKERGMQYPQTAALAV